MLVVADDCMASCASRPDLIKARCHVTGTRLPPSGWRDGKVEGGRPDLARDVEGEGTHVFACGPPGLVRDARRAAAEGGASFHSEEFEL